MEKKIKIGWVGSGFVGQVVHLVNFAYLNNVEIFDLAELRQKLGRAVCQKYDIPNYYKNHHELMNNSKIDVIIAIVNSKHTASVANDILKKRFNLFTEKPMAATYDQAKN